MAKFTAWLRSKFSHVALSVVTALAITAALYFTRSHWRQVFDFIKRWLPVIVWPWVPFAAMALHIFRQDVLSRRRMRLAVEPVARPGSLALLVVTNHGIGARYYVRCRILGVDLSGRSGEFHPLSANPRWEGRPSGDAAFLRRGDEVGLCLASCVVMPATPGRGVKHVSLHLESDHQVAQWDVDYGRAVTVRLKVTLVMATEKSFFRRLLPNPKPYSAEFAIVADHDDGKVFVEAVARGATTPPRSGASD